MIITAVACIRLRTYICTRLVLCLNALQCAWGHFMHYCTVNVLLCDIYMHYTTLLCKHVMFESHLDHLDPLHVDGSLIDCYLSIIGVSGWRRGRLWHHMRSSVPRLFWQILCVKKNQYSVVVARCKMCNKGKKCHALKLQMLLEE